MRAALGGAEAVLDDAEFACLEPQDPAFLQLPDPQAVQTPALQQRYTALTLGTTLANDADNKRSSKLSEGTPHHATA